MSERFGLLVTSAVLLVVLVVPVSAQTIGPAKPGKLRVLQAFALATPACPGQDFEVGTQVLSDGSQVPFTIPPGKTFVITGGFFDIYVASSGSCRMSVAVSG